MKVRVNSGLRSVYFENARRRHNERMTDGRGEREMEERVMEDDAG